MIEVSFIRNKDKFVEFVVFGHAGYAEYGKDIVCASVSVLAINTINSIDEFTNVKIEIESDEEKGFLRLKLLQTNDITELLIKSFYLGISNISNTYNGFITLSCKEV